MWPIDKFDRYVPIRYTIQPLDIKNDLICWEPCVVCQFSVFLNWIPGSGVVRATTWFTSADDLLSISVTVEWIGTIGDCRFGCSDVVVH